MPEFNRRYFDNLYAESADPWRYETSAYERRKYDATMDALPRPHYESGLELGCSIGVLTARLAGICGHLTAVDTSGRALDVARRRCSGASVDFVQAHLPEGDWTGHFDLVVLSEVLYFLTEPALAELAARLSQMITDQALILLVHWTGPTNYPLTGDEATLALQAALPCTVLCAKREPEYRLDLWTVQRD